jgi:hypothetical protein
MHDADTTCVVVVFFFFYRLTLLAPHLVFLSVTTLPMATARHTKRATDFWDFFITSRAYYFYRFSFL